MRILAFTDIHANKRALAELGRRATQADVILCAGDVSEFGMDLLETLEIMNSWNKPIYIIHGNHEDESILADVNQDFPNIEFVHGKEIVTQGIIITGWGGGGFALEDPRLATFAKKLQAKPNRILMFHGPPHGTAVDYIDRIDRFVGCKTRRAVIEKLQPFLVVSGHIHETFNRQDKIGRSIVINPGPLGKFVEVNVKATSEKKPVKKTAKKKTGVKENK